MLDDARAAQVTRKTRLEQQLAQVSYLFKPSPPSSDPQPQATIDPVPKVDRTTNAMLRKVRGDAHELLRFAQALAHLTPLTTQLAVPDTRFQPVRPTDTTEDPPPPSELANRDAYVQWEIRRALDSLPHSVPPEGASRKPEHDTASQVEDLARRL